MKATAVIPEPQPVKSGLLADEFLNFLSVEKGLSQNTLEAYSLDIHSYHEFLRKHKLTDFQKVRRDHITRYLVSEKRRGLEASSVARRLAAIKVFHRFLVQERYLNHDVTDVLETPKLWRRLPHFLTPPEVEAMLNAPDLKKPVILRKSAAVKKRFPITFLSASTGGASRGSSSGS